MLQNSRLSIHGMMLLALLKIQQFMNQVPKRKQILEKAFSGF